MILLKNTLTILALFFMLGCGDDTSKKEKISSSLSINDGFSQFDINTNPIASQSLTNNVTGEDNIVVYYAYGDKQNMIIAGRAQKKEGEDNVSSDDGILTNFINQLDFFNNDEIKNTPIIASFDNRSYKTTTDDEGYFRFEIYVDVPLTTGYKIIQLNLDKNPNIHQAQATIFTDDKSQNKIVGIISDIDDTIIVSDVTLKTELFFNTFWKNFKQRELIPSSKEKFQEILQVNPSTLPTPLFFVSGSPTQLTIPIEGFLEYHQFPNHITVLKQLQGDNSFSLFSQDEYKLEQIRAIIALYPDIEWVLFGDSGEEDKAIYQTLQDEYPNQIKGFYIRDVDSGESTYYDSTERSIFDRLF